MKFEIILTGVIVGVFAAGGVFAGNFVIGEVSPLEAFLNVPVELSVEASDNSGISSCDLYVSSKSVGAMSYDDTYGIWRKTWTFDEFRVAYSVRAKCVNGAGDALMGPVKVLHVSDVDIYNGDGDGEVDATGLDADGMIARSPVLVKTPCPGGEDVNHPCRTVYFLDKVGKRHAFPNENVFFSWYDSFDGVNVIAESVMTEFGLGDNVWYMPNHMFKFPSVNTVYVVGVGGHAFSLESEAQAVELFGVKWNTLIEDLSEAFYGNYEFDGVLGDTEYASILDVLDVSDYTINLNLGL